MARQTAQLSFGTWLLHDELEHSVDKMKLGPFKWVPSTVFGKAESNMLVLNSHLDATIALDRYAQVTGDQQFSALVRSARDAAGAVLSCAAQSRCTGLLFWLIGLTFLPASEASALPLWKRALKRLTWKYVIPRLPDIKARFPRVVMPGGYIDRELTLRTWAHDYHAINLMDLARYLRRFDDAGRARGAGARAWRSRAARAFWNAGASWGTRSTRWASGPRRCTTSARCSPTRNTASGWPRRCWCWKI